MGWMTQADLSSIKHEAALSLVKKIAEWPRQVRGAAENHEPHRIAFYLYDLASEFHSLYNLGAKTPELRFVQEGNDVATRALLALIRCTAITISNGLRILGVTPVQEMR